MANTSTWRTLARGLWLGARGTGANAGPVHLNAAFREPLVGTAFQLPDELDGPIDVVSSPGSAHVDVNGQRVLAVVGLGVDAATVEECVALDWVVVGDATARGTTAYFDPLLRDERFVDLAAPDLVIRLGGLPASKILQEKLRSWNVPVVALSGSGDVADPDRIVRDTVAGLPRRDVEKMRGSADYVALWREASNKAGEWFNLHEHDGDVLDEPGVAREMVASGSRFDVPLVIGSSMPVRDVEWFTPARTSPTFANRGVNGIDGVVSTVLGVGAGAKSLGLRGDLTLLHDVSGLVEGLGEIGGSCVIVVPNNHGGGIFSFLAQAHEIASSRFEQLFGTPRLHNLAAIAEAFGHASVTVNTRAELRDVIATGLCREGLTVVIANVPSREENVQRHDALNRALGEALWAHT
jgi:2-succinyl-5-enolpyruvyl-6-hydroxy-3-cyclohexene-1-carboxylate synthase